MSSPAGRAFTFSLRTAIAFALSFACATAVHAQTAQISGTVTAAGAPVGGIGVHLARPQCCEPDVALTTTQADGSYVFGALPDGVYVVRVDTDSARDLRGGYYGGANEFDRDLGAPITISGGSSRPGIDIVMGRCATVSGSVSGLSPAEMISIQLSDASSGRYRGGAGVLGPGTSYTVSCTAPGVYRAFAETSGTDLAYQYYLGQPRSELATTIVVAEDQDVIGIDFALVLGATISGTVTLEPPAGDPAAVFPRIQAIAIDALTHRHLRWVNLTPDGTFALHNLPAGTYIIEVRPGDTNYSREVWSSTVTNTDDYNQAERIVVTGGMTAAGKGLTLEAGRQIGGHLFLDMNADGVEQIGEPPVPSANINANLIGGAYGEGAGSDALGNYVLYGLRPGVYQVQVESSWADVLFVAERWNGHSIFDAAYDAVDVSAGDRSDVNFSLLSGVEISGTAWVDVDADGVFDAGESPLTGGTVRLSRASGGCCVHAPLRADGSYRIQLSPGSYFAEAWDNWGTLIHEYWNDAFFWNAASAIDLTAGNRTGINFSLVPGSSVGTLQGVIEDGSPAGPIAGVDVHVQLADGSGVMSAVTDGAGRFAFINLPPATYQLLIQTQRANTQNDTNYISTYWTDGGGNRLFSFPALAGVGTDLGTFTLVTGGSISGTVSVPVGETLPGGLQVYAHALSGTTPQAPADVASGGAYRIRGVPAGAHRVQVWTGQTDFIQVYYLNGTESTAEWTRATAVTTGSGDLPGIDLFTFRGGSITGTVTDGTGTPVPGVPVSANGITVGYGGGATTDASGVYLIGRLIGGSYEVRIDARTGPYANQYYPTAVVVTAPNQTAGIDFTVAASGTIRGRVTRLEGVNPVPVSNLRIEAMDCGTGRWYSDARTDANGNYAIGALPRGISYRVRAAVSDDPASFPFVGEYFDNAYASIAATPVTVPTDTGEVSGIDFSLEAASRIEGSIALSPAPGDPAGTFARMWVDVNTAGTFNYVTSTSVRADGTFSFSNLAPGSYVLQVNTGDTGYIREVWADGVQDVYNWSDATPIVLIAGGTASGKNFTLALGQRISGHVFLDANGSGAQEAGEADVAGASMNARTIDGSFGQGTSTDASGNFVISGLRSGVYQVTVEAGSTGPGFVAERWNGRNALDDVYETVDVTSGDVAGINFSVLSGHAVSGRVCRDLDANGACDAGDPPVSGTTVRARLFDTGRCCVHAWPLADGTYRIHLAAGSYRLEAFGQGTLLGEFWNNQPFQDYATALNVSGAVGGVDFSLVDGSAYGTLRGRVTNSSGVGIPGVDAGLTVFGSPTAWHVASARTDADGYFVFSNLPAGDYRIFFDTQFSNTANNSDYVSAYWSRPGIPGVIDPEDMHIVFPAGPGGTDVGSFVLATGGSISGTVHLPPGDPGPLPSELQVQAESFESAGNWRNVAVASDGTYRLRGLAAPATYRIQTNSGIGDYVRVYYHDALASTWDYNLSQAVQVAAGAETSQIDLYLEVGGSISGRVTDDTGTPLPGIPINGSRHNSGFWLNTRTGADGIYHLRGAVSGDYTVRTDSRTGPYGNVQYPGTVTVTAPADTPNINFTVTLAGVIRGRVTQMVGGVEVPVVNIRVQADDYANGGFISDARTNANGDYAIGALARGRQYRVAVVTWDYNDPQFFNFIGESWNNRRNWEPADPVPADPGGLQAEATGIDFLIAVGGSISGTVIDHGTGLPLTGVQVKASRWPTGEFVNADHTDHNGFYIIRGLPAGQYRVNTWLGSLNYVAEYYDNTTSQNLATPVTVLEPTTPVPVPVTDHIDFGLARGATVAGTITEAATGNPIGNMQVNVSGINVSYGAGTQTLTDGTFRITGLPAGRYTVTAAGSGTNYARSQTTIEVAAGDVSTVNFGLRPGARLSGRTYVDQNANQQFDEGEGRANVNVSLSDYMTGQWGASARSDAAGNFEITGVSPGGYRMQTDTGAHNFVRTYYNNTLSYNNATAIVVNEGNVLGGYDFRLVAGHQISGLVFYDANGDGIKQPEEPPVSNVNVNANRTDGQYGSGSRSRSDGTYTIYSLLPGTYRLQVNAQGTPYASEYFKRVGGATVGTHRFSLAELVDLTADLTGVDFSLALGGTVAGAIREDGTNTPIAGINVNVNAYSGDGFGFGATTDQTGTYRISGLPADAYRVYASDPAGVFVNEYYQDKVFSNDAASVAVVARSAPADPLETGVNMNLGRGGAIEGVVYHDQNGDGVRQGGEPGIANVVVWANEAASSNRNIRNIRTTADGTYRIGGLPADLSLKLQANPYPLDFVPIWYDGGNDRGVWNRNSALAVTVATGGTVSNITFALDAGGAVIGTVRDGNGAPLGGINVNANVMFGTGSGSGSTSGADGQFALHGISAGTFRIWAGNTAQQYGQEYFDNQRDSNAATPITIVAGTTRTDIHFVLPLQPLISGPPSVTSAERGTTLTFTLAASRLAGGQCAATPEPPCSRVEFGGSGVTIQSSTLDTATGIFTVQVAIAADAPVGARSISVVNDFTLEDAAAVRSNAFDVVPRAVGDTPAIGGDRLYVADGALSQVQVYRTADHTLVQTIDVCCQPATVTLSPDGNFAYVSGAGERAIGIVDTRLGREVGRVQVDGNSGYYSVAATSKYLFVVNRVLNDRVRVIDAKTWQVLTEIIIGANATPWALRADPLGRWVYVANSGLGTVSVIDANPGAGLPSIISTIPLPASTLPRGIAFTPDGSRAYVVAATNTYLVNTALAANPATAAASLIDTDGDLVNGLTPLPTRGTGQGNIAIAPWPGLPGTVLAYIAVAGNRIWIVDVTTDRPRIVRDISAGYLPRDLRTSIDGSKLFVTHTGSKDYYEIDTANLLLAQPQIPVSMTRFARSPGVAGTAAVGPIPPSPPADAPSVSGFSVQGGGQARNDAPITLDITGANFDPSPIVWLANTMVRGAVTSGSSSSLTVELPAGTPAGDFHLVVTNPRDTGNLSGVSAATLGILPPAGFAPTQPVYVASYGMSGLTVLQPDGTRDFIHTQPYPGGLSITPDGKLAIVPHMYSGPQFSNSVWPTNYYDVSLVDLASGSATFRDVVATIPYTFTTFNNPAVVPSLEYLLGKMYVYVPSGSWVDMVAVIDPATLAEVDIDANPTTQSIEPGDADVGQFASKLPGINRIELDGFATDGNMIIQQSAITPDGALLYVSGQGYPGDPNYAMAPPQVTIVDTGTNQVVGALRYAGAGDLANAVAVAVSPTRLPDPDVPGSFLTFVYVVARLATNDNALLVYRAYETNDHAAFVDAIALPELTRYIAVSRDGRTVYVSTRTAEKLIAIDVTPLAGGGIAGTTTAVTGLAGINGLAVAPDDGLLYVSQLAKSQVLVFNITANPLAPQFVTALGVACPTSIAVQPTVGRPRVSRVAPTSAPPEGGTSVVISGANFGLGATVAFGNLVGEVFTGVPATNVVVENAYTITATVPPGTGAVDVKVTNADGQFDILQDRFTYEADIIPPVFTTPPYVASLALAGTPGSETAEAVIRWRTDEPSSSQVDYGIGSLTAAATDAAMVSDHQIALSGLATGAAYVFRATSADVRGNTRESPESPAVLTLTTPAVPDVSAPVITSSPVVSVTTMSATIQWVTNETSTSLVQYDAQIDGVLTRQSSGAGGTTHSVTLSGLTPNTLYEYRALSVDGSGNGPASAPPAAQPPATFRTAALPDTTPPEILTGPSVSYLSRDLVIVTWTTDEPSSSFVNYGVSSVNEQGVIDRDLVTTHIVFLTNLAPGTRYGFQAGSSDASGNTVMTADPFAGVLASALGTRTLTSAKRTGGVTLMAGTTLTTLAATMDFTTPQAVDSTPPAVTAPLLVTALAHDRVIVTVGTDEAASLLAEYGLGVPATSAFDPAFTMDHGLILAGLSGGRTYVLNVTLTDPKGNATAVTGLSFTTPAAPDVTPPVVLTGPVVSAVTQTSAVVTWTTDESADGSVRFAMSGAPWAMVAEAGLRLSHRVALNGLVSGTQYQYEITSHDASGNEVVKAGEAFTTAFVPPAIGSVTPDRLTQGQSVDLVVSGAHLDADVSVQLGSGIVVNGVAVNAPGTALVASLSVATGAAVGPRTLTVLNPRSGLTATAQVTVVDGTIPIVTITEPAPGADVTTGAVYVRGTVSESAHVTVNGVTATVTIGPPVRFEALVPLTAGFNRLLVTATDASGNRGTALTGITLTDAEPPTLQLSVAPQVLRPPNHQMVEVTVSVSVTDDTDPAPRVELVSVTSSEPDDAVGQGDGDTTDDIQLAAIGTDDRVVLLRAERDGSGLGRIYTLTYRATDRAGHAVERTVDVLVPHDRR